MRVWIIWILLLPVSLSGSAQVPVGQWRDHLPYYHATAITQSEIMAYCATGPALFSYHKKDHSVQKISKVNGLSDVGIKSICYSDEHHWLVTGYENGNIDLLGKTSIVNISDIKRYPQITGNKSINHILLTGDYAYLSCGFGIVVLNLIKQEISDTYYIGEAGTSLNIYQMATDGLSLFAATEEGILHASVNDPDLPSYTSWTPVPGTPPSLRNIRLLAYLNGILYAACCRDQSSADTVYAWSSGTWTMFDAMPGEKCHSIRTSQNRLVITYDRTVRIFSTDGTLLRSVGQPMITLFPRDAVLDQDGNLMIADMDRGLVLVSEEGNYSSAAPNGPYSDDVYHLTAFRGRVYASGGGRDGAYNNLYKSGLIHGFVNEAWSSTIQYSVHDIIRILVDPENPDHFHAASWGYGILEYLNRQLIQVYNTSNSTLQSIIPGENYVRIGGMALDTESNLWVTNTGVTNTVSVRHDDEWIALPYPINAPTLGDIMITSSGHKWILLPRGYGLFAFDDKGTPANINDDNTRHFSLFDANGKTITSDVFSIAEDKEENIWVGTNQGPLVYYYPRGVFSGENFYASQVKIPSGVEGQANYLLATETITSIAIDGANRKWFGTAGSGAYLFSEDGTRAIHHFTSGNSPLVSDNILSLCVVDKTGEVFFGTDKGIVSFRSTATEGADYFTNVYVFPNPVRESYHGVITITGLVRNTTVKITDISGNLVYETTSDGGQATWDGKNLRGDRVHTGVYLVFCSTEDGSETCVTKLLFIH